jgi:hypothetical protein
LLIHKGKIMPRHHMTSNGPVPFTPEEEAERDAEEAVRAIERANPTPPPAPTKEQLLAELQALTAKINALG